MDVFTMSHHYSVVVRQVIRKDTINGTHPAGVERADE